MLPPHWWAATAHSPPPLPASSGPLRVSTGQLFSQSHTLSPLGPGMEVQPWQTLPSDCLLNPESRQEVGGDARRCRFYLPGGGRRWKGSGALDSQHEVTLVERRELLEGLEPEWAGLGRWPTGSAGLGCTSQGYATALRGKKSNHSEAT